MADRRITRSQSRSASRSRSIGPSTVPAPATQGRRKRRRVEEKQHEDIEEETAEAVEEEEQEEEAVPVAVPTPAPQTPAPPVIDSYGTPNPHTQQRAPPMMTPARMSRVEEKQQMQELNRRLEYYIMLQRERDASVGSLQRELDTVRENAQRELDSIRRAHEEQLRTLRAGREEQSASLATLNEEKLRQANMIKQLQNQLTTERKKSEESSAAAERLSLEMQAVQQRAFAAEEEVKMLSHQLKVERAQLEGLREEVSTTRTVSDDATSRVAGLETALRNLKEDYDIAQQKHRGEVDALNKQLSELQATRLSLEDELRKEFGKQLNELLAERQLQFEEEKAEGIAQLKELYDDKLAELRDQLDTANAELDANREKMREMQSFVDSKKYERSEETMRMQILETRIKELEEESIRASERHEAEVSEKVKVIQRLKKSWKQKDEEFDALIDVKIALAMEINAYRQLLETEEERLGYPPPTRKSKDEAVGAMYLSITSDPEHDGAFAVRVRNGTIDTISLEGWSLKSLKTKSEYKLPARQLEPRDTLTILTGLSVEDADEVEDDVEEGQVVWRNARVWDAAGDAALLLDPSGVVVSKVDVTHTGADE